MPMNQRVVCVVALSVATVLGASCKRADAPVAASKSVPGQSTPSTPAASPLGARPAPDDHGSPDGGTTAESAIIAPGEWSENRTYKFRLERVAACGATEQTLGPAQPAAAGGGGQLRGESSWVGALFSVQAKEPSVFVTPRDLELRRGGVILGAKYINQPVLSGCQPLLPATRLRAGDSARGFALFEVPKTFRIKTEDPIVLSYRPTRWGGARRVEVPIRECLDACPAAGTTAGRTSASSRKKL
jgi:hypothetical protein